MRAYFQGDRGKGFSLTGLGFLCLLLAGSCVSRQPQERQDEPFPIPPELSGELPGRPDLSRGTGLPPGTEAFPKPGTFPGLVPGQPEPVLEPSPGPDFLTLVAAGDNLFHDVMIRPPPENESYRFESIYSLIKPYIEPADIAFINQETLLAGEEFGFSGYPRFNTPRELGDALLSTGFDVVNHATNHIMDKGEKAVFATMDYWNTHPEMVYLGIHGSPEQRERQVIIEKNHIKVGFLAYTMETNALPVPRDKPHLVSLGNTAVMAEEIDSLRPNCDFLVVSMHWGVEYEHSPNAEQEKLSGFLAEHGVDLVIGHHPHVIQPFRSIPRPDGGTMHCFYSLGNFVSAQIPSPTLLGGLMYLRIKKSESALSVEKAGLIPVVTYYEKDFTNVKIYPLPDYTEELAKSHRNTSQGSDVTPLFFTNLARQIFGSALIEGNPFISGEEASQTTLGFADAPETNSP